MWTDVRGSTIQTMTRATKLGAILGLLLLAAAGCDKTHEAPAHALRPTQLTVFPDGDSSATSPPPQRLVIDRDARGHIDLGQWACDYGAYAGSDGGVDEVAVECSFDAGYQAPGSPSGIGQVSAWLTCPAKGQFSQMHLTAPGTYPKYIQSSYSLTLYCE